MKTWRRFLAVFLTIAMLVPMTAIGEDAEAFLDAVIDSQEGVASVEADGSETAADAAVDDDTPEDSATPDDAPEDPTTADDTSEEPAQEEDVQAEGVEVAPNEMVLDLSENGAETSEENQEPVQKEVDFTAKKIELNMDKGTTLLVIPVNGEVQEQWSVPKAAKDNVKAVLRADGVTEITAQKPVKKVKLSAKVKFSAGKNAGRVKKVSITLNVNDPNAPRAITITGLPTSGVPVGRTIDLSQHIVIDPPAATLDSVEIKVTGAGKLDSAQYPHGMVTTKKGTAKITVTSRSDKKVKSKAYSLKVLENKVAKMTSKPGKADLTDSKLAGGWTMWPLSLEVKGNVLKCQFNVINGTNDKMAQIKNMTIKVAAGRWSNIIAEGTLPQVSASVAKQKSKTVKFDLKINPENMKDVFLPEAWSNKTLHFLINQGDVKLTGKKGENADFIYCNNFPEPGVDPTITLDRTEATLTVGGEPLTLVATVVPADLAYTWSSSDESVATVAGGVVTPVGVGTTIITATAADGSEKAECVVTVIEPDIVKVTQITLSSSTLTMTEGETQTLTASVLPDNATNKAVNWSSDNTAAATVDNNGMVTAVVAGTATIIAEAVDGSGVKATCVVTVNSGSADPVKVTSITLDQPSATLVVKETLTLHASVLPENATNRTVSWFTDKPAIATVDVNGTVTAVTAGTANITAAATDGSGVVSAACVITVNAPVVQGDFFMSNGVVTGYTGAGGAIAIPEQDYAGNPITAIGANAFKGNTTITKASIPLSVTEIRESAFEGCTSLCDVTAPNKVITIGKAAFKNCINLENMDTFG